VKANEEIHIIGAGLAGLSAAVQLVEAGKCVRIYEATSSAGGRCRSFYDGRLERIIDNGNHLILSGNKSVMRYLELLGAENELKGPELAEFPFIDLADNSSWTVRPGSRAIPWSIFNSKWRIPGISIKNYYSIWRLSQATPSDTVGACFDTDGVIWHRFWRPIIVSVLNTDPAYASANLLWKTLKETFGLGEVACRPLLAVRSLSQALVDPALSYLSGKSCKLDFNKRVRKIISEDQRVKGIETTDLVEIGERDAVILSVPPYSAAQLAPNLIVPNTFQTIVNGHFRIEGRSPEANFIGVVGGTAEWLFVRGDVVSVTISAANELSKISEVEIADKMWADISSVFGLGSSNRGPSRVIKEKRATFEQTPEQVARRPSARAEFTNMFLAGDWTDTGIPATIEGAVRSGIIAANSALEYMEN
tara:strand:- start:755 stop:2014 length:1260 start_codon:yes stop_codon:yes gene_type:complete